MICFIYVVLSFSVAIELRIKTYKKLLFDFQKQKNNIV